MKTAREDFLEKFLQQKRHPVQQKLVSFLLCSCLLLVSLPMEFYGSKVQAQEPQKKILSFSDLPKEVREQAVEPGTPQEKLNLPETLTAVCISMAYETPANDGSLNLAVHFSRGMETVSEEQPGSAADISPGNASEETGANDTQIPPEEQPEAPPADAQPEQEPEVPAADAQPEQEPEGGSDVIQGETVLIEDVAWACESKYDSKTEGAYVFTPVLSEIYVLANNVKLPEIHVTVKKGRNSEIGRDFTGRKRRSSEDILEETEELRAESPEMRSPATPQCGIISEDTTWGAGTLENGELVVEPGVTLTINGLLTIKGNVTIRGGGIIKRGNGDARFRVDDGDYLTAENITIEGNSIESSNPMIEVVKGGITLGNECVIRNCIKIRANPQVDCTFDGGKPSHGGGGGAVLFMQYATGVFHNPIIENNSCTVGYGGAAFVRESELTIYGGTYQNNSNMYGSWTGGCLYNVTSKIYIYGGRFLYNTSTGKGGCIMNSVFTGTETHLYGWYFEGNTCSYPGLEGSGAVYHVAYDPAKPNASANSILDLSGNVQFCGNGIEGSGVDGIYLDMSPKNGVSRKVQISNTLSYPVTLYLKQGLEGYVIAEGTNDYILLHERDMKKINFIDTANPNKKWYAVLDKEKNEIYLSEKDPQYGYYVHYISNGAKGTVVDDGRYEIGDTAKVQSDAPLEWENHAFLKWNTKADGTGDSYLPGDDLPIQGDTDLYAIFEEGKKTFRANFYSGSESRKETRSITLDASESQGTVEALEPEEWDGWEFAGWERENPSGYGGAVQPGQEVTLTEDVTNFYAVYRKDVTLSYVAEGAEKVPESQTLPRYANVHETIGFDDPEFTIAQGPGKEGFTFTGWNTDPAGNGDIYTEGGTAGFTEDAVLYAMYSQKKVFSADFWSGSEGGKERISKETEDKSPSVDISAPELKELEGWEPVGWDAEVDGYEGDIKPGASLTLEEPLQEYYGIYKKSVTLTYDANGGGEAPEAETRLCHANVHGEITYKDPEVTLADAPARPGYDFLGWSSARDGGEPLYAAGDVQAIREDTTLYAAWKENPDMVSYQVEHYCQDLEGDGYTRMDGDTETLTGLKGTEVTGRPKKYAGFTADLSHPSGKDTGIVAEDGSLVLKFYYNRDIYEVDFNLNGGQGTAPETQKVRYGGLLEKVSDPARLGYNFKGWHIDEDGLDGGLWDFESPVENNTGKLYTTLCAEWADELAPVMGKAAFGKGHKSFKDWLIQKESMSIAVPVTEEGSGLAQAEYLLVAEDGTEKDGAAQITENSSFFSNTKTYGAEASAVPAVEERGERSGYEAKIFIEKEFKGKVYLTCKDHAGNVSAQKTLTAKGGGVIVEDNAPEIYFSSTKESGDGKPLEVKVQVRDDMDGHVTAGISGIRYQIDKEKKKSLPEEAFSGEFVETHEFTVKITGAGKHTLRVEAEDRGGNESAAKATLRIHEKKDVPIEASHEPLQPGGPGRPLGSEPKTGDGSPVKIYATAAMIAGFGYLLLYFEGENGITEQEKEEILSRLVSWAKQGGKIRRYLGLAIIFLFLAYYHSIGKSVSVEWKEVYVKK